MNKIYRLKFSQEQKQLVVVSEIAKGHDHKTSNGFVVLGALALSLLSFFTTTAHAGPSGATVVNGQAQISNNGNVTTIHNTDNTIINWNDFSIQTNEIVNFVQNNANSSILNRVTGGSISEINGMINSNGNVFVINPNGIIFGKDSIINANSFVASTLDITNENFKDKNYVFNAKENAIANIINNGAITVNSQGKVALLGQNVENNGVITAPNGDVLLLAGNSITVFNLTNARISYVISAEGSAVNLGKIFTKGGNVNIAANNVEQRGVIKTSGGKVFLTANNNNIVTGTIDASSETVTGGEVRVLGSKVKISSTAKITSTGTKGGEVYIGGDDKGKGTLKLAAQTQIEDDAVINVSANATVGDAGKIIVWGNQAVVSGNLVAKGGSQAGKGGFVETSGKILQINPNIKVNLTSENDLFGTWLLDPTNINIVSSIPTTPTGLSEDSTNTSAGAEGSTNKTFTPTTETSYILNSTIETALQDANVILDTSGTPATGAGEGNINVEANITGNLNTGATAAKRTLTFKFTGDYTQGNIVISTGNNTAGLDVILDGVSGKTANFINGAKVELGEGELILNNVSLNVKDSFLNSQVRALAPALTIPARSPAVITLDNSAIGATGKKSDLAGNTITIKNKVITTGSVNFTAADTALISEGANLTSYDQGVIGFAGLQNNNIYGTVHNFSEFKTIVGGDYSGIVNISNTAVINSTAGNVTINSGGAVKINAKEFKVNNFTTLAQKIDLLGGTYKVSNISLTGSTDTNISSSVKIIATNKATIGNGNAGSNSNTTVRGSVLANNIEVFGNSAIVVTGILNSTIGDLIIGKGPGNVNINTNLSAKKNIAINAANLTVAGNVKAEDSVTFNVSNKTISTANITAKNNIQISNGTTPSENIIIESGTLTTETGGLTLHGTDFISKNAVKYDIKTGITVSKGQNITFNAAKVTTGGSLDLSGLKVNVSSPCMTIGGDVILRGNNNVTISETTILNATNTVKINDDKYVADPEDASTTIDYRTLGTIDIKGKLIGQEGVNINGLTVDIDTNSVINSTKKIQINDYKEGDKTNHYTGAINVKGKLNGTEGVNVRGNIINVEENAELNGGPVAVGNINFTHPVPAGGINVINLTTFSTVSVLGSINSTGDVTVLGKTAKTAAIKGANVLIYGLNETTATGDITATGSVDIGNYQTADNQYSKNETITIVNGLVKATDDLTVYGKTITSGENSLLSSSAGNVTIGNNVTSEDNNLKTVNVDLKGKVIAKLNATIIATTGVTVNSIAADEHINVHSDATTVAEGALIVAGNLADIGKEGKPTVINGYVYSKKGTTIHGNEISSGANSNIGSDGPLVIGEATTNNVLLAGGINSAPTGDVTIIAKTKISVAKAITGKDVSVKSVDGTEDADGIVEVNTITAAGNVVIDGKKETTVTGGNITGNTVTLGNATGADATTVINGNVGSNVSTTIHGKTITSDIGTTIGSNGKSIIGDDGHTATVTLLGGIAGKDTGNVTVNASDSVTIAQAVTGKDIVIKSKAVEVNAIVANNNVTLDGSEKTTISGNVKAVNTAEVGNKTTGATVVNGGVAGGNEVNIHGPAITAKKGIDITSEKGKINIGDKGTTTKLDLQSNVVADGNITLVADTMNISNAVLDSNENISIAFKTELNRTNVDLAGYGLEFDPKEIAEGINVIGGNLNTTENFIDKSLIPYGFYNSLTFEPIVLNHQADHFGAINVSYDANLKHNLGEFEHLFKGNEICFRVGKKTKCVDIKKYQKK